MWVGAFIDFFLFGVHEMVERIINVSVTYRGLILFDIVGLLLILGPLLLYIFIVLGCWVLPFFFFWGGGGGGRTTTQPK